MTRRARLLAAGALLSVLAVAVLLGLSDLGALRARARELDWTWAAVASVLAVGSYACIAGTQATLLAILGHRVPAWFAVRASMISVVVARTLRSGGTSGLAFLAVALSRRGVPVVATLSMGVGNVLVNACVATGVVLVGVVLLMTGAERASAAATIGYAAGAGLLVGLILVSGMLIFREGIRRPFVARMAPLADGLGRRFHRPGWGERLHDASERVSAAAGRLLRDPRRAWRAWAWAIARIVASLLSLAACARAADVAVTASALILAFTAMKLAGSLAFVPAGLGIVDGSLAGMLTLLGAPYEAAILVAVLHRVAYHVVPAVVALAVAGSLLVELLRARPPGAAPT